MTRKLNALELARAKALEEAIELGFEYFRDHPDEILAAVHRYAHKRLGGESLLVAGFVEGYKTKRDQRDDYRRERKESE